MEFPSFNFDFLGEADVREEIIAPLLRALGYRSTTLNDVIREQALSYPQLQLGRRKPTDPLLRGRADYICTAGGGPRWTIEAKAPNVHLTSADEEQAWSYANHPEVRAVYFVLTNGRHFKLYQSNQGPEAGAIFECAYEDLGEKMVILRNLLEPASVLRDHPLQEVDVGLPIGPGLRSIVRVTGGQIRFDRCTAPIPPLGGMLMSITGGSVERSEQGHLEARLSSTVPFQLLQNLNEKLGLHEMHLRTDSVQLSVDACAPTIFKSSRTVVLPKGLRVLDLMTWKEVEVPMNVTATVDTTATGSLLGNKFVGEFVGAFLYREFGLTVETHGRFEIHLA